MNYIYITGSSKGLGKALVQASLNNHFKTIGLSRHNDIDHPNFKWIQLDLSDAHAIAFYQFDAIKHASSITLINNAGVLGDIDKMGSINDDQIQTVMQINLISPSILINKFLKAYQNLDCTKTIINISSGAATSPYESWSSYCASKAGLEMMSKVVQKENHPHLHVFSIAPGVVDTDMQAQIRQTDPNKFIHIEKFLELKNAGSLYDPQLVAAKILDVAMHPALQTQNVFRIILP